MIQRRILAGAGVLLLAVAAAGALLPGAPPPPRPLAAGEAPVAMVPAEPYDPSADLNVLQEHSPWGAAARRTGPAPLATAGGGGGPASPWRVVGVLRHGSDQRVALLFQPQNRIEYRQVGEALPDGRRIVDIRASSVELDQSGTPSTIPLFTGKR